MSNERTAVPSPSHVDLDAIIAVLRDHPEANVECRIAFSLYRNPDQRGMRALERSANIAFHCVLETLSPDAWGLSPHGLVQTIERGKSWDADGREVAIYRLTESVREGVTKSSISKNPSNPVQGGGGLRGPKGVEDGDTFPHRFSPQVWELLDPALDTWSRRADELGPEGWRVAMLTGMEPREMSAKEWAELAGGADRSKRLAKKFLARGVMSKTGKARATRYVLHWSYLLEEQFDSNLDRTREGSLLTKHAEEQVRITEPLTPEEIRAGRGEKIALALLAELDGTESPGHRADVELLAGAYSNSTVSDWSRWYETCAPVSVRV